MKKLFTPIYALLLIFGLQACSLTDDDDPQPVEPPPPPPVTTITDIAASNPDFETLVVALQATGLDQTLADPAGTFTVFAPTDAAFDALIAAIGQDAFDALLADTDALSAVLTYHVLGSTVDAAGAVAAAGTTVETVNGASLAISVSGDSVFINGATVVTTDIVADNGIIHIIDAVLSPPAEPGTPTANIVETAVAAGDFTTLVAALEATGLDAALAGPGPLTVFAPTDAAFELLGDDVIGVLLDNPEILEEILLQHVVGASVNSISAFAANGTDVETLSTNLIPVGLNADLDTPTFGGANVVTTDIYTTNGIIHVIDMVIVGDVDVPPPPVSVVDRAVEAGNFTTLVAALQATGLDATLSDPEGTFTVFAPTDDAFALLGQDTIDALLADLPTLTDILTYHVLGSVVNAEAAVAAAGTRVATVNGADIAVSFQDMTVYINGVTVTATNILADNGVIHVIDAVLTPPAAADMPTLNIVETAIANDDFNTLVAAVSAAGLVDTLSNPDATFTVFAPTDAAFEALGQDVINVLLDPANIDVLTEILTQHVVGAEVDSISAFAANGTAVTTVSGNDIAVGLNTMLDTPTFGGANVVVADIQTTNGIIHVIDMVVVDQVEVPAPPMSIVDVAVADGNFTTLVAALQATGLDATLADLDSDFTVFAPTDAAFALLGDDTINALLADLPALTDILTYHVLSGQVLADAAIAAAGTAIPTVNGANIAISLANETLFINGVSVTANNVLASNGVIHVIDAVLLPPAEAGTPTLNIVETAVANDDFNTLVAAVTAADLVDTLSGPGPFTVFAPTDAAFAALGQDTIDTLLDPANISVLTEILTQHVVGAEVNSIAAFTLNGMNATTVSTNEIPVGINATLDTPTFGGANVVIADIYTTNGIIHVIDAVVVADVEVPGASNISAPADFSGTFGGATVADDVYTFPGDAEGFAGFANVNTDLYPFTFSDGGLVRFTASIPEGGVDTNVRFVFENAPFPNVDPNFSTVEVLVTGNTDTVYEVAIPAQDPAQGFNSFLMYVVERDQPVKVTNVVVEKP